MTARNKVTRHWIVATFCCYFLLSVNPIVAGAMSNFDDPEWGNENQGLRLRILAVAEDTDEQEPDFATVNRTNEFKIGEQVTFLVQLKNVSQKPISFQNVRYGDSVSDPWPGKSKQTKFGPLLFTLGIYDQAGNRVKSPSSTEPDVHAMLQVSSGAVETLEPGTVATMLIKPIQWDSSLATSIAAGKYAAVVTYHGTPKSAQEEVKKHWPDKPLGDVWNGTAESPRVSFQIENSYRDLRPILAWGKPKNGLRVAAEYRLSDQRAEDPQEFIDGVFPIGSRINVRFYIQNTIAEPIEFESETWRQDDKIFIVTDEGDREVSHPWYSGIALRKSWTIKPKQIVTVDAIGLSFPPEKDDPLFQSFGAEIKSGVGEYRFRHDLNEGISTGETLLTIRSRKPSDDPPAFPATLKFETPKGTFAENGFVKIRTQTGGKALFEGEVAEALELENWTGETLRVYARFAGFEENTFHDVNPTKDGFTSIKLTPSSPILMKLVDAAGNPVADADVRYFIRTRSEAKSYPFPMQGIKGPVHATSDLNGNVKLDSVQAGYIYSFYIEPKQLAPMFVLGIAPGTDLGQIKLSKPFDVSGVIRGTPEQLKNFAAEWDQAVPLLLSDGTTSSQYAVSKKLPASRDGDQIKFQLTNLRPGKLRIIANFGKHPHSVGHAYGRRKVGPSDELFELELTGPRDDIVIQAKPD